MENFSRVFYVYNYELITINGILNILLSLLKIFIEKLMLYREKGGGGELEKEHTYTIDEPVILKYNKMCWN